MQPLFAIDNRRRERTPKPATRIRLLFLLFFCLIYTNVSDSFALEFVTQKAFSVEKNPYKEYPFRVLFQKLHESKEPEKSKIKNVILLKQVYEDDFQVKLAESGEKLEKFYGVVQSIDTDSLRLWLPEADAFKDIYVGIDRIPLRNPHDFEVSATNIDKFAAVVHVMDNRVYIVEIDFNLLPPDQLSVQRRGDKNIVEWKPPEAVRKPSGYRVFVNDKPYKTIERPRIDVPRSKDQADEYFVKAVYSHKNATIESDPSPTVYDEASAKEMKQKRLARQTYQRMLTLLNPTQWPEAQKLLTEHRYLLKTHLEAEKSEHVRMLSAFFLDMQEGERLTDTRPQTLKNLKDARIAFERAAEKADSLPDEPNLKTIPRLKLAKNSELTTMLEEKNRHKEAGEIFARIEAALNPTEWEDARALLRDNRDLLMSHLDSDRKAAITVLAAFFRHIDEGDRLAALEPAAITNLESAMKSYQSAEKKAEQLKESLDVGFVVRIKTGQITGRIEALRKRRLVQKAKNLYDQILVSLNPSDWKTARDRLYQHQAFLLENLDEASKAAVAGLVAFFKEIDEGDRLVAQKPKTPESMALAGEFYRRAGQKAVSLPEGIDVGFIPERKIRENESKSTILSSQRQKQNAETVFRQIAAAADRQDYSKARNLMEEHQMLLLDHLGSDKKQTILALIAIFRDVDEGDGLAGEEPLTEKNLDLARTFYHRARKKAESLSGEVNVKGVVDGRIGNLEALVAKFKEQEKKEQAENIYARAVDALNPKEWQTARSILRNNRQLLQEHLDPPRERLVERVTEFFDDIDAGDAQSARKPAAEANLEKALYHYQNAGEKLEDLTDVDLAFIVDQRVADINDRKAQLEKDRQKQEAENVYQSILGSMTPSDWERGKQMLLETGPDLEAHLDAQQKANLARMADFFRKIEEGDRIAAEQPENTENLEAAMAFYRTAQGQARSLSDVVDLAFVVEKKIAENTALQTQLENQRKAALATRAYEEVLDALNPENWETAQSLALEKLKLLTGYLDSDRQETAVLIIDFFRDIQEGDQSSSREPATEETLDSALALYRQAEEKAIVLSDRVDVMFVAAPKIREIEARKAELAETQRAIAAAQEAQQAAAPPQPAPAARAPAAEPFDRSVDPQTALGLAMKHFNNRKYGMALNYFSVPYTKAINNIKKGGKKRIFGLLALPPQYRAEIVFLVKLDALQAESGGDRGSIRSGLLDMMNEIDGSTGPWSIITEPKKNKIRRHIDRF